MNTLFAWIKNIVALSGYTIAVTVFFLWFLFPADFFRQWAREYIQSLFPQYLVNIDEVALQFPGKLALTDISVHNSKNDTKLVAIDSATIWPDFSAMILTGQGVLQYRLNLYRGRVSGEIKPSGPGVYSLEAIARGIRVENADEVKRLIRRKVKGTAQGEVLCRITPAKHDISFRAGQLRIEHGEIGLQGLMFGYEKIPFTHIFCRIAGDMKGLSVKEGIIQSPLFMGDFSGELQLASVMEESRVEFTGRIQPRPPFFAHFPENLLEMVHQEVPPDGITCVVRGMLKEPGIKFGALGKVSRLLERDVIPGIRN
ncbi:MAG: type II secretion system protein GspN [Desulfobulbus propionicus]|nr:MAG: type II secretion system protein GspN [Desulfobulbus propionicus]